MTSVTTRAGDLGRACRMISALVDLALALGGRHYLAYQTCPTRNQVIQGYPEIDEFFAKKVALDPEGRFSNGFFETYAPRALREKP